MSDVEIQEMIDRLEAAKKIISSAFDQAMADVQKAKDELERLRVEHQKEANGPL